MDTGNLEERYKEMMLIKNGMVIDPANRIEQPADVLVKDGRILRIAKEITEEGLSPSDSACGTDCETIDRKSTRLNSSH